MKHDFKVTLFLLLLFFTAQAVGLFLLNQSIESIDTAQNGTISVKYSEPITGRPDLKGSDSFTYTLAMILIGTALLLFIIRLKLFKVWKVWFFLAIFGALSISFSIIIPIIYAVILALVLTYLKMFRPNLIIHNITEVFMYGGIVIILAPMFTVFYAFLLLVAISIYDAIAVWKLKHMITLATAQAEEKMFAGLLIPYTMSKEKDGKAKEKSIEGVKESSKSVSIPQASFNAQTKTQIKLSIPKGFKDGEVKSAILGGGDIAFPMIFSGSVMTWLIEQGISKNIAFLQVMIIALFSGIGLFLLLIYSKKDRFYPAMPFISAGCFVGYGIVLLLQLL